MVTCSSAVGSVSVFPATQLFPAGTTTVTCVADDGRGNTATGTFTVRSRSTYGILGPLSPYQAPPKTYNSGSSVPIAWKYTMAGVAVAAPFPAWQPQVRFVKVLNWRNCANSGTESTAPQDTFVNSATPGNSVLHRTPSSDADLEAELGQPGAAEHVLEHLHRHDGPCTDLSRTAAVEVSG